MTPKPTREPLPKANCREKPNHLRVLTHFTAVFLLIGILSGGRSGHLISPAFAQTEIFYRSDRVGDKSFDTYYDARQVMIRQDRYWYDPAAKTWVGQTVDANGAVVQVIREENSRVHNDFGLFLGENIKTTKERFRPGSALPYEVSVSNEYNRAANSTDLNIWDTIIGDTKITTIKTYSQSPPRTLLKTVVEELRAVRLDAKGSPIYAGTRTTTTPDGVTVEILEGTPSQQWKPDPTKLVELPEADVSLLEMRCRAATGKQKALTTEEQDLSDARVKLDLRITELKRDIFSAKAWKPLESYQWDYQRKIDPFTGEINRDYEVGVRNYCGFCGTAEKSIMRRFWGTFGPPDAQGQSTHYNPVPQAVDEVRYLYEERLVRRARGNMIEGLLRGSPLSLIINSIYTDWGLRDYYLELEEPRLKRHLDQLALLDAQLAELRERLQKARDEKKQLCEKPGRRLPLDLITTEPATDPKPQPDQSGGNCSGGGIIDEVICVEERMRD